MSKERIIEILEKHPAGLSILEIAEKTKLHRNSVARIIKELEASGEVELKKIGIAKIYFLKRYSGIHKIESGYAGKNISIGIGVSDLEDGFNAAVSAAKQAAMQASKGATPKFSLVFVSSRYNTQIDKIVNGINKILGSNWIGCTTDREVNSILGFSKGTIEVLCIDTPYMYFGVGVSENYRKNPIEEGRKTIVKSIQNCPVERSKFATSLFLRGTKKEFADIIKNPPYFILTFISGLFFDNGVPVPGLEYEFLEGIKEVVGSFIPIVGASAVSDVDNYLKNIGENYVFANGRYYKNNGAVVCFVTSELYFSYGLEHGYIPTNKSAMVTKVSENGRIIEKINNNDAVDEYCRLIDVKKEEFLNKSMVYTTTFPISLASYMEKAYPIASGANPDGKTLFTFTRVSPNSLLDITKYDEESSINTMAEAISQAIKGYEDKPIALSLVFSCAGRRSILGEKVKNVIERVKEKIGDIPIFGFYSNGEIGARRNSLSRYNNFTITTLIVFDQLQVM